MTSIQRISGADLMELAAESAGAPRQMAVVLILAGRLRLPILRQALAERVGAVPRLRQRLRPTPLGCGRPVWVDDPDFGIDHHLHRQECPAPGDDRALLDLAAAAATAPLRRDRPLWSLTLVDTLSGGRSGLVLVMHHVLADGVGGLAALAQLVDGASPLGQAPFPRPAPSRRALFADATGSRVAALRRVPDGLGLLRAAASELRIGQVSRPSTCSLNQPTGPYRRLSVARADLAALAATAHAVGGTGNDVVLSAAAGALGGLLDHRNEAAEAFVISVPVSSRRRATATQLGNRVGVIPVPVPARGKPSQRLAAVVSVMRAARGKPGRGASATLLGPVFRILARLGVFGWFVDHQRLVTTFVTTVRGPLSRESLCNVTISEMIAVSPISGNVTVAFAALSYAGTLTVTVIVDPERCPEADLLTAGLQDQLDALSRSGAPGSPA